MSNYSLPQIDPETSGQVTQMYVPLDAYLGASFDQGQHDSAFNSVMRMEEMHLDNVDESSPMLTPEQAQQQYGVGDLKFDQPIRQVAAMTMHQRKKAEMDRNFFLSQGSSKARFLPGMAASMLGGVSNPLDLGLMFIPVVGEERLGAKLATEGAGAVRQAIARGMISSEALARNVPVPRLVGAVLQGTITQAPFELLNLAASHQDQANYTGSDAVRNIVGGGILAGALHSAGALFEKLSHGTKQAMMEQAVNQFLKDEDIRVHDYVMLDEEAIRQRVKFDADKAKYEALGSINEDAMKQQIFDTYHEKVVAPAMMLEDGTLVKGKPGEVHIDLLRQLSDERLDKMTHEETIEGFLTESGRFVSREEAAKMMGMNNDFYASENITNEGSLDWMSPDEFDHAHKLMEDGMDKADAINKTLALREQQKRKFFFDRPEIQEKLRVERQSQIDQYIEKQRNQYDEQGAFTKEARAEIQKQQAAGKMLTDEQVNKYFPPDKSFAEQSEEMITKDVENLKRNLETQSKEPATVYRGGDSTTEQLLGKIKSGEREFLFTTDKDNAKAYGKKVQKLSIAVKKTMPEQEFYDLVEKTYPNKDWTVDKAHNVDPEMFRRLTEEAEKRGKGFTGGGIEQTRALYIPEFREKVKALGYDSVEFREYEGGADEGTKYHTTVLLDPQNQVIDKVKPKDKFPLEEQAIIDSIPKPQEKSISAALDCLTKIVI